MREELIKNILFILFVTSLITFSQSTDLKLKTIDGVTLQTKDLYQKGGVLINFWALWCEPCRSEMRHLNDLYNKYKNDGFALIGINQDSPKSVAKVKSFLSSQQIDFPVSLDPNFEIFNRFNGQVLPYSLLIDKNGDVVYKQTGYIPGDEKKIENEILKLLNKSR